MNNNGLSFSGYARFPEFQGTINDSFSLPWIERVLCSVVGVLPNKDHYRLQWQWFTIQARHWHWDFFVAGWMQDHMLAHVLLKLSLIVSRNSVKSRKWQSMRNYSWNKKFSTQFDDLGVIIIKNKCSIQQGETNNCWLEQNPEKLTVLTVPFFFRGPPGICFLRFTMLQWN